MKIRLVRKSFLPKILKVEAIALYPFMFFADERPSVKTINHELIHILQVRRDGFIRFYFNYLKEYFIFRKKGFAHREAYLAISYEVEAYSNQNDLTYTGLWSTNLTA